jgi:hypothetical protein
MSDYIFEEFEKYLNPEEKKAYEIYPNLLGSSDIEDIGMIIEEQIPSFLDYSLNELFCEIRNGNIFLKYYERISIYNENEIESGLFVDFPSVEAFRNLFFKMFSWFVVQGVYNRYGLDAALDLVDCFKSGFRRACLILLYPQEEVLYNYCERIKYDLIEIHNGREFFYWDKSVERLQELHDILKARGLIIENNRFIESFKKENIPKNLRTKWIGHCTDLVFLTYFLFNNVFGELFYKRTYSLFFMENVNYSIDLLRQTYNHIKDELLHPEAYATKRKELIEIIDRLNR